MEKTNPAGNTLGRFLGSVREATFQVDRCQKQIDKLDTECKQMTARYSAAPGGGGDVHKDSLWAALADQRTRMKELEQEVDQAKSGVESFLRGIPDDNHRRVLTLRFVDQLSVQEAADVMNYSKRHVSRLLRAGLWEAQRVWDETMAERSETP